MITLILTLYGTDVIRTKPIAMSEAVARIKSWQTMFLRVGSVRAVNADGTVVEMPSPISLTVVRPA